MLIRGSRNFLVSPPPSLHRAPFRFAMPIVLDLSHVHRFATTLRMPAPRTGFDTIPGHLTHYLDELDLSRKDLSEMLGVSVRTIHNIEYGRKRANRDVLDKLATVLNQFSAQHRHLPTQTLTADHFIDHPESIADVFLQSILLNDCSQLFIGENPIASSEFHWEAPGKDVAIPFAGDYSGWDAQVLLDRLHATVDHVGLEDVRFVQDRMNEEICVQATSLFRHTESQQVLRFDAYVDIDLVTKRLGKIKSTYDSQLLAEFLQSGISPKQRKSQSELR